MHAKPQKSRRSEPSAKNDSGKYATFETALREILSVPRSKLNVKLAAEKRARTARKKASSRVSRAKA
jgi:hypothetical protein